MGMMKIILQNLLETAEKVENYTTHLRTINLRLHLTVLQKVYTVFSHKQVCFYNLYVFLKGFENYY